MSSILHRSGAFACLMVYCGILQAATGALTVRDITVSDMGLVDPVTLSIADNERHFYFPIPPAELLDSATISLDGRWFRAYDESGALTVLVNGEPVLTYALTARPTVATDTLPATPSGAIAAQGQIDHGLEISLRQALQTASLKGDFLDLGIVLGDRVEADHCLEERGRGNELVLDTSRLRLRYAYRSGNIVNVRNFLATLPRRVDVLLPGQDLTSAQYETALRIARGLSSMGLATRFLSIPREGEVVPVDGISLDLPWDKLKGADALRVAVNSGKPLKLANADEIAAWLIARMLSSEGLAQMVVDPVSAKRNLLAAIGRSRADIPFQETIGNPNQWIFDAGQDNVNLVVGNVAGRSMLMVDNANAASLLGSIWKQVVTSREAGIQAMESRPEPTGKVLHIARDAAIQYVVERGEWQLPVRLSDFPAGQWPAAFDMDLVTAPNADGRPVIASVLFNDTLLMSTPLMNDGKPTTIHAPVPLYTVRADNVLRVQVNRRPDAQHCARLTQGTPVQLLPTSIATTRDAPAATQFYMLQPLLDKSAEIVVPRDWLSRSLDTLNTVDAVLEGFSLRASSVTLRVSDHAEFTPRAPYIAFETRPHGASLSLDTDESRLLVRDHKGRTVFDSTGLKNLAVMEMSEVDDIPGVFVAPVGGQLPMHPRAKKFVEGSFLIADSTGPLLTLNLRDDANAYRIGNDYGWMRRYSQHWRVLLGGLLLVGLPLLLVLGARAYIRRQHRPH